MLSPGLALPPVKPVPPPHVTVPAGQAVCAPTSPCPGGTRTGAPITRVSIVRDGTTDSLAGKDVLVLGSLDLAQTYAPLFANSPVRLENKRLRLQKARRLMPTGL